MKILKSDLDAAIKYYGKYVDNQDDVKEILYQHSFEIVGTQNSINDNKKRNYSILIDDKSFLYSEGPAHKPLEKGNGGNKLLSAINCLLLDYYYGTMTLDEFVGELGAEGAFINIHRQCVSNKIRLDSVFTASEIQTLTDNINL